MRASIKRTIKTLFLLLVFPFFLLFLLMAKIANEDSTFQGFSQFFSLIPGKFGIYSRAAFYHLACPGTSDEISIGFLTLLSHRNTTIEKGVYIGPQCNIGMCTIRKNSLLGSGVHILSGNKQHDFSDPDKSIQDQGGAFTKIVVGSDCWIGNGAIVMADVMDRCIVAAGSVLTGATSMEGHIYGGNPAKPIKCRDNNVMLKNAQSTESRTV